jgi:hypothetical protein
MQTTTPATTPAKPFTKTFGRHMLYQTSIVVPATEFYIIHFFKNDLWGTWTVAIQQHPRIASIRPLALYGWWIDCVVTDKELITALEAIPTALEAASQVFGTTEDNLKTFIVDNLRW